jgi:hypothetical protein
MQKKTWEIALYLVLAEGASGAADHAVGEHEAIMQFETGRLTVPSYRRRNRKEAAVVPCYWWTGQRTNRFSPEVSYGVQEYLRLGER